MKTLEEKIVDSKTVRRKSLVAFSFFLLFLGACICSWIWLINRPEDNNALQPLRKIMDMNEKVFGAIVSDNHKTKTFPLSEAVKKVRVNGDIGMDTSFNAQAWQLYVIRNGGDTLFLNLEDIQSLPKTEIVFDFKCIEGWSQVTHWGGVKFTDFVTKYGLEEESELNYVGLSTPDKEYYVGIDRKSILHPQTILCYEMNGQPLPMDQGYPLRLIIPVKYGIKHLKRIGTLFFSDERPPDYWFERGYDYFSGL